MKKFYFVLMAIIALTFASCSQEEDERVPGNSQQGGDTNLPYTKAQLPESMEQVLNMPVFIYIPNGQRNGGDSFLTIRKGSQVAPEGFPYHDLLCSNLSSDYITKENQKWIITHYQDPVYGDRYMIKSCGYQGYSVGPGINGTLVTRNMKADGFEFKNSKHLAITLPNPSLEECYMWSISPSTIDQNLYVIYETERGSTPVNLYLSSEVSSYIAHTNVINPYARGAWAISPAEEFEFVSVSYRLDKEDELKILPSVVQEIALNNGGDVQQSMAAKFSRKITETSSFSRTHGFSVSVSTDIKVKVPLLSEGKLTTTTESSNSWTFGGSSSIEDTYSYDFPLVVPAGGHYTARMSIALYDAKATYIAKYKGKTSKKIIELEGKWNGIKAGKVTYDIIKEQTKQVVKTFQSVPTKAVVLD